MELNNREPRNCQLRISKSGRERLRNIGRGKSMLYSEILDMLLNSFFKQEKKTILPYKAPSKEEYLVNIDISNRVRNLFHSTSERYRAHDNAEFVHFLCDEYESANKPK